MAGKKDNAEAGERITAAPSFRLADIVNLSAILASAVVAIFTAFGLSERISEVGRHQTEFEQRIEGRIDKLGTRLDERIDKLSDRVDKLSDRLDQQIERVSGQITGLDERLSRIEGAKITSPSKSGK